MESEDQDPVAAYFAAHRIEENCNIWLNALAQERPDQPYKFLMQRVQVEEDTIAETPTIPADHLARAMQCDIGRQWAGRLNTHREAQTSTSEWPSAATAQKEVAPRAVAAQKEVAPAPSAGAARSCILAPANTVEVPIGHTSYSWRDAATSTQLPPCRRMLYHLTSQPLCRCSSWAHNLLVGIRRATATTISKRARTRRARRGVIIARPPGSAPQCARPPWRSPRLHLQGLARGGGRAAQGVGAAAARREFRQGGRGARAIPRSRWRDSAHAGRSVRGGHLQPQTADPLASTRRGAAGNRQRGH